jgi:acyl-CoA dehydrogenase
VSAESAVLDQPPLPHYFSADHEQFRAALRAFIAAKVTPFVDAWDEAGSFPLELYRSVADLGATGIGFPEAYGGTPGDVFYKIVLAEEYARCGCGGVVASLNSHTIALPPIVAAGSDSLKQRVLPPVLRGERVAALAITEPSGGSDVAAVRTSAVRDGDGYVVNGEKTFITSGMRADFITVAVRTDPASKGATGVSLLLVDGDTAGLTRTAQRKMGWWSSDTAHLRFDGCRVPVSHLVGEEHRGFRTIMNNFNAERLFMAAQAYGFAQVCFEEALAWARDRQTFGQALVERQVIRHKLVDMALRVDAARTLVHELAYRIEHGLADPKHLVARIAMAKVLATQAMQFCADQAVQILGGMGFMRGTRSERIYREVKVMMIGGGAEEVMKDLASRQLEL